MRFDFRLQEGPLEAWFIDDKGNETFIAQATNTANAYILMEDCLNKVLEEVKKLDR